MPSSYVPSRPVPTSLAQRLWPWRSPRRLLIRCAAILALFILPVAQSPVSSASVPRNQTLILGFENFPNLAPHFANPWVVSTTDMSAGLHQLVFESLFYLNYVSGKIQPWLGTGYDFNKDSTAVTIHLRKGVHWSDGVPFTADDVVFTIQTLLAHPALWNAPTMVQWVKSVSTVDPLNVKITLKAANPRFILQNFSVYIWGGIYVAPKHIFQGKNPETFNNFDLAKGWPVTTGPYGLTSMSANQAIYDRRDNWWGAKLGFHALPAPKRVVFVAEGPSDARAALLVANQADGMPQLDLGLFEVAHAKNPKIIGWTDKAPYAWIDPCPVYFSFNTKVKPWDDPQMRWALSYAIKKQAFANLSLEGPAIASRFLFPDYPLLQKLLDANNDLFTKYPVLTFDLKKTAAIFQSKGYKKGSDGFYHAPNGQRLSLTVSMMGPTDGGVTWGLMSAGLSQYFTDAGVDVKIRTLSGAAFGQNWNTGDYQALVHWSCGSVNDPLATLNNFNSSIAGALPNGQITSSDQERYSNPAYNKIVNQIALLPLGDPRIKPLFRQALEIFLRDAPAFGLFQQQRIVPYNTTYWTNWPTATNAYIHPPNWWATSLMLLMNIKPAH